MITLPNKSTHILLSYPPTGLLPIMGKILDKLLLNCLIPILESQNIIPDNQFQFGTHHPTIQRCHRIVAVISSSFEHRHYCTAAFLDVKQAFDRVWYEGLLVKFKGIMPFAYQLILRSYLTERFFYVSHSSSSSPIHPMMAGVPQGSILAPILYSTFADDTCVLLSHRDPVQLSLLLQHHLETWFCKWKKKRNNFRKCINITFPLRRSKCPPILFNNSPLPTKNIVNYLVLYIDKSLTWNPHDK